MAKNGDEIAAQELFLFISYHSDLYRQMIEPIMKNLSLAKLKGIYDHTKALKLWANLAAAGAKLYNVEFGSGKATLAGFDVATRLLAADKLQDYYEDMLDPENWAGQRGFKNVGKETVVRGMKNPRNVTHGLLNLFSNKNALKYTVAMSITKTSPKKPVSAANTITEAKEVIKVFRKVHPQNYFWIIGE